MNTIWILLLISVIIVFVSSQEHKPKRENWRRVAIQYCRQNPNEELCRNGKMPTSHNIDTTIDETSESNLSKLLGEIGNAANQIAHSLETEAKSIGNFIGGIWKKDRSHTQTTTNSSQLTNQSTETKTKKQKETLLRSLIHFETPFHNEFNFYRGVRLKNDNVSDGVQRRLNKTLQVKKEILKKAGISNTTEAEDDGTIEGDILLTEERADELLNLLNQTDQSIPEIPKLKSNVDNSTLSNANEDLQEQCESDGEEDEDEISSQNIQSITNGTINEVEPNPNSLDERRKRSAIYFEESKEQRWNSSGPIPFYLDESLNSVDKNDVRSALLEIQQKTCIRFQELLQPASANYIHYYHFPDAKFCGLSYIGKASPANPVYLSFSCPNPRGIAIHETLHALGVAHQQLRTDRDQHITINWTNVNPQQYDTFAIINSKKFTTYGVPYAYDSIMHAEENFGAININQPTIIPKVNPNANQKLLGQRQHLSKGDIELLTKMYCQPKCEDKSVYCGVWALQGYCTSPGNEGWLQENCKKSCNLHCS